MPRRRGGRVFTATCVGELLLGRRGLRASRHRRLSRCSRTTGPLVPSTPELGRGKRRIGAHRLGGGRLRGDPRLRALLAGRGGFAARVGSGRHGATNRTVHDLRRGLRALYGGTFQLQAPDEDAPDRRVAVFFDPPRGEPNPDEYLIGGGRVQPPAQRLFLILSVRQARTVEPVKIDVPADAIDEPFVSVLPDRPAGARPAISRDQRLGRPVTGYPQRVAVLRERCEDHPSRRARSSSSCR